MLTSRCIKQIRVWSYGFALNSVYFVWCVLYAYRPWLKVSNISRPITSASFDCLSVCLSVCLLVPLSFFICFELFFVCLFACFSFLSFLLYISLFPPFYLYSFSFFFLEIYFIFGTLGHHNYLSFVYIIFSLRLWVIYAFKATVSSYWDWSGLPCLLQLQIWLQVLKCHNSRNTE